MKTFILELEVVTGEQTTFTLTQTSPNDTLIQRYKHFYYSTCILFVNLLTRQPKIIPIQIGVFIDNNKTNYMGARIYVVLEKKYSCVTMVCAKVLV